MLENIIDYINIFFFVYIFIYAILFFIATLTSMVYINNNILKKIFSNTVRVKNLENYIPVSVLIPAYNEDVTVIRCIESVLNLNYKLYEVIIINDGSTDNTEDIIINHFGLAKVLKPIKNLVKSNKHISIYEGQSTEGINITLINKKNGGKGDALNSGINTALYPYVACIDADSILQKDALREIIKPFLTDEKTIAVGGNIKISNNIKIVDGTIEKIYSPKSPIVIFQMLEYCRVFLTTRVWLNTFNGNLIISGAFGLFKKKAIINIGGYNTESIGEDMDLVVKLHSFYRKNEIPYSIQYSTDAICYSQAPSKYKDLKSQRARWHMGLMESLLAHKYIFLNINYGIVGGFSFLYFFIFEFLSCIIEFFGIITIVISYTYGFINEEFFITFLLIYIIYSCVISIASIILEGYLFKGSMPLNVMSKLIFFSFIEPFGYRQFCSYCRLLGIIKYSNRRHAWNKIQRNKHK